MYMSRLTKLLLNPRKYLRDSLAYRRARSIHHTFESQVLAITQRVPATPISGDFLTDLAQAVPLVDLSPPRESATRRVAMLVRDRLKLVTYLVRRSALTGESITVASGRDHVSLPGGASFELDDLLTRRKTFRIDLKFGEQRVETLDVQLWDHVPASPEQGIAIGHVRAPRPNPWANRVRDYTAEQHGMFEPGARLMHLCELHPKRFVDECAFPVDVVYTWVDHRDPRWQQLYEQTTGKVPEAEKHDDLGPTRFLSRDELRYSLRSVAQYAPWVRTIHIASNCAPPTWLDLSHPRIRWVDHSEFMPVDGLPVFNSHAIESRLHHIPDLANHFLYFNDDFFLLRRSGPGDFFFSNGLSKSFFEGFGSVNGEPHSSDLAYLNAARNGKRLLERDFGVSVAALHKHTPYALRRDVLLEMEQRFAADFARTARSRFRHETDLSTVSFLYHHYAYITGRALPAGRNALLVKQAHHYARTLTTLLRSPSSGFSLCLNDGAGSTDDPHWNRYLAEFLRARFPRPAEFERLVPSASDVPPVVHRLNPLVDGVGAAWVDLAPTPVLPPIATSDEAQSPAASPRQDAPVLTRTATRQTDRVVVHVGAHKTATSLVQKFLRDEPQQAIPRGLRYISRAETNELIGWGDKVVAAPSLLRTRIGEECCTTGARYVFVSHENTLGEPFVAGQPGLYSDAARCVKGLAKALRGFDARIVLSIRPQAEFLESYYLQSIHEGGHLTFNEWLAGIDVDSISWLPVVEAITSAIGVDRLVIVDFRDLRLGQDAFLRGFFERAMPGLEIDPHYDTVRNPSISAKGLQMALAMNQHLADAHERKAARKFLQQHFSNRKYDRPVLLSDEQRARLSARYDEEYDMLTRTLKDQAPNERGAHNATSSPETTDSDAHPTGEA